jgi:hypothetical protein
MFWVNKIKFICRDKWKSSANLASVYTGELNSSYFFVICCAEWTLALENILKLQKLKTLEFHKNSEIRNTINSMLKTLRDFKIH